MSVIAAAPGAEENDALTDSLLLHSCFPEKMTHEYDVHFQISEENVDAIAIRSKPSSRETERRLRTDYFRIGSMG